MLWGRGTAERTPAIDGVAALPARAWFAYPVLLLVQARALWGLWDNDLTPADSSYYFALADLWHDDARLNLAWSPLYAAYYGTARALVGGDAMTAENVHRAVIVLALAALVLAIGRRLLPPAVALLVALWWVVLPINFDSVYEVHLFAPPFLLGSVLLLTGEPGPWRRGAALSVLLLSALLVRNEALPAFVLLAAALSWAGLSRRGRADPVARRKAAIAIAVPLLIVSVVVAATYTRGVDKGDELREAFRDKEQINLCQSYAFNYRQRHPDRFTGGPSPKCTALMQRAFGQPRPTLRAAWAENPRAMSAYTAWHVRLFPHGIQLGLFDAVSGGDNPDYAPAKLRRLYPALLSIALVALVLAAARVLRRAWPAWRSELHPHRWAWAALGAITAGTVVVSTFFQRPRPSYMFGLNLAVMFAAGLALTVLVRHHRLERPAALAAVVLPLMALALLPVHYRQDAPTPIADAYRRLEPVAGRIAAGQRLAITGSGAEICNYVAPNRRCATLDYPSAIRPLTATQPLSRALDSKRVRVFYVDPTIASDPPVARLLAAPRALGWRIVGSGVDRGNRWAVLVRGS